MREIKFRYIHKNKVRKDSGWFDSFALKDGVLDMELDDGELLEQYTGLKDKNGKEIYEGDVCETINIKKYKKHLHMSGIRQVVFNIDSLAFEFLPNIVMTWGGFESIEIIGNIHENKDLL